MAIPNKNIGAFQEMLFSITLLAFYTRPVVFTYDTNHRIEPVGSCTDLQAGYEDGTYLKTIHSALNN